MGKTALTIDQINSLIDGSADILVEGLKLVPADAGVTTEKILERIGTKLADADLSGDPSPLKILHAAVNIGAVISETTPSEKDDALFAKADAFLDKYEENGEKLIGAFFTALAAKLKK